MIRWFDALCLMLALGMASGAVHAQDNKGPTEWTSAPCTSLALGPTDDISHLQRIYLFGPAGHTTQYKFFADDQCKLPLYSFVFIGGVKMGAAVKDMPDAVEATVTFKRVLFTLDSPRGAKAAGACADGKFKVGVQRDVSNTRCLFMKPVKTCGVDHDIVKIKDGVATPGLRTANMCTAAGRPTQLQSAGARLVEQF